MLKKNSVNLEKDAIDENIFYISFNYISLSDFNIKIFFNACENVPESLIGKEDDLGVKNKNGLNGEKDKDCDMDILKEDLKTVKENDLIDINIDESEKKNFK